MNAPEHNKTEHEQWQAFVIDQLGDIKEQVNTMSEAALTAADVRRAVADGFMDAISSDAFWPAITNGMQRQAHQRAGGWLFGGLRELFSKLAWLFVIGLGIYLVGGWTALVAFFKSAA